MAEYVFKVNARNRMDEIREEVNELEKKLSSLMIVAEDTPYTRMTKIDEQARISRRLNELLKESEMLLKLKIGEELKGLTNVYNEF